jgi:sn-glycerol 3-phosphate transport system substrate-binding protein
MKTVFKSALPMVVGTAMSLTATVAKAAELEFYFPVGVNAPAVATIEQLTNAWAAQNPQHSVKAVYAGNYEETTTKALTAAQAGDPPQVAVLLAIDIFTLIEEDVILPISDIATSDEDKAWIDSFYDGFMVDTRFDGKVYSIPFQRSTPVFYYNKDAWRAAGLDPEVTPATWDEMVEVGKKLTVKDDNGNVTQWGTRIPNLGLAGAWLFGGLVKSKGDGLSTDTGTEARFDTEAARASLEFMLRLADEEVMSPGGITWGDTPKAFLEGQAASIWTSTGNLAFINENAEFDWGVGFLPGGDGPGAPVGGGNFYIFKNITDEEREAALDFVRFMTTPENQAIWSMATGYVAPSQAAWETPEMQTYAKELPQALVALEQMPYAYREFATFQRARVTQFLVDAIESVITGGADPAAALAEAQEKADEVLSEYR